MEQTELFINRVAPVSHNVTKDIIISIDAIKFKILERFQHFLTLSEQFEVYQKH